MSLKVAVQMDHISGISIAGDSTFALLLEAAKRGHQLVHYTPDKMRMRDGIVSADVAPLTVRDEINNHFDLGKEVDTPLKTYDVILLRQDPPFDMGYITTTHFLETLTSSTLVVNDPASVRNAPEKILVTSFPQLMPPTLLTNQLSDIQKFLTEFGDIVMKPLYGNGGKGVFRLQQGDENLGSLADLFSDLYHQPWVIQQYLPDVRKGDKRIILVDGVFAGAVNRVPADDDMRSNMVQGGRAEATELSAREKEICDTIGPLLKERGLLFVGIDVIGGHLTEINVTSPTGLRAITNLDGPNIAEMIWHAIEEKVRF